MIRRLLGALDRLYLTVQNAAKRYGLLPRNASGVSVETSGTTAWVVLAAAPPAWQAARVPVPSAWSHRYSVRSVLHRGAIWRSPVNPQSTVDELTKLLDHPDIEYERGRKGEVREVVVRVADTEVLVRVGSDGAGRSVVWTGQRHPSTPEPSAVAL